MARVIVLTLFLAACSTDVERTETDGTKTTNISPRGGSSSFCFGFCTFSTRTPNVNINLPQPVTPTKR